MRRLIPFLLPLLTLAQAPYQVMGEVRYRGYYPLGSWEGKNPTARGVVLWDGDKASGQVCLERKAWDSGNGERDKKAKEILKAEAFPQACPYPKRAYYQGARFLVEGDLEMAGRKLPVRLEGVPEGSPENGTFRGGFRTRFSEWGLERPRLLFLEVRDEVEVFLQAQVRR
ncbi:YceI family protein [Thermus albus]|uniref:YceI family protein n=1 Tax=Thermus albus TaxID=2908146 RepID=UPI001FAA2077|nr:YceI family protein [Thermus albus]